MKITYRETGLIDRVLNAAIAQTPVTLHEVVELNALNDGFKAEIMERRRNRPKKCSGCDEEYDLETYICADCKP